MSTGRLASAVFFAVALGSAPAWGSAVTTVGINGNACATTQTYTGPLSASGALLCSGNTATGSISLNVFSPSLALLKTDDSAAPFNVSTTTVSFDAFFYVTGGTGTGFLALDYINSVSGFKDAQASANATFTETLNGSPLNSGTLCLGPIAVTGSFSCSSPVPVGFAFTYGTPFELAYSVTSVAGGGLGGSQISASGSFSYAILTGGSPNQAGALNLVPEPGTFGLLLAASGALLMAAARKFAA